MDSLSKAVGEELALIFSALFREKLSGRLNFVDPEQNTFSLVCHKGEILDVESPNSCADLLAILENLGFITSEESLSLAEFSSAYRNILLKLTKENRISPHFFSQIQEQYLTFEIERLLSCKSLRIDFTETFVEKNTFHYVLDKESFLEIVRKMMLGKPDLKHLVQMYSKFKEYVENSPKETMQDFGVFLKEKMENIESTLLGRPIKLEQIVSALGIETPYELAYRQSEDIVKVLLSANMIIEPNLVYFKKRYNLDEQVIISKLEKASMLCFDEYKIASVMADFGVDLAYADGNYSDDEAEQIYSFVSSEFLKEDIEKEHLRLRLELHKAFEPEMDGVFHRISENLNLNELKMFSSYLVKVALADGVFRKEEDKKIRTAFLKLGLGDLYIRELYENFGISEILEDTECLNGIHVDQEKCSRIAADTEEVQSVLAKVFDSDEDEIEPVVDPVREESEIVLDEPHRNFMNQVLTKQEWDKKAFRETAKEFGLMVHAAVVKINEWAEENYGDWLISENATYVIQSEIMN